MASSIRARRQKGKALEALVAETLHKHLMSTNSKYNDIYSSIGNTNVKPKRDSSSGVFKSASGDIELGIAKPYFPFSVECKNQNWFEKITLTHLFKDKIKPLYKILEGQATEAAKKAQLAPILIFHGRCTEVFVFWNFDVAKIEIVDGPVFKNGSYRLTTLEVFLDNACAKC